MMNNRNKWLTITSKPEVLMNTHISFIKRHPLGMFFGLTFALTWPTMVLWLRSGREDIPWFTFGPLLAALIVTALVAGREGLQELLRRQVQWRVGAGWYAVALGLPIALELATVALNVALGAQAPTWDRMRPWPNILSMVVIYTVFSGPLGEELGWRGFALPRLVGRFAKHRYGALAASLILGVIHAAWHLPLLLGGEQDVPSLLGPIAAAIVFTWLFQHARGSVLIAVLFHAAVQNSGRFLSPVFAGTDAIQQHWVKLAIWIAAAVIIVLVAGPARLARRPAVPAERAAEPMAAI
jgi:membrane protease YdiL (CAAX protease family)